MNRTAITAVAGTGLAALATTAFVLPSGSTPTQVHIDGRVGSQAAEVASIDDVQRLAWLAELDHPSALQALGGSVATGNSAAPLVDDLDSADTEGLAPLDSTEAAADRGPSGRDAQGRARLELDPDLDLPSCGSPFDLSVNSTRDCAQDTAADAVAEADRLVAQARTWAAQEADRIAARAVGQVQQVQQQVDRTLDDARHVTDQVVAEARESVDEVAAEVQEQRDAALATAGCISSTPIGDLSVNGAVDCA